MASASAEPLPPEVRRTLAEKGAVCAGEHLVRYAESLARSRAGEARLWGARMARSHFDDEVVNGCARWAAGVAMYLSGDVVAAEPTLVEAARRLNGADNRSLADRARRTGCTVALTTVATVRVPPLLSRISPVPRTPQTGCSAPVRCGAGHGLTWRRVRCGDC
jgi:hypothetical protein